MARLWRLALRLLPSAFRERHAEEMTAVLGEHLAGRSRGGRLLIWLRALADVVAMATIQHARGWRGEGTLAGGGLQDLAYAARGLARRPGFTTVAVLTLALGTGVTTAMASLVYTVVMAPSPYATPGDVVQIALSREDRRAVQIPAPDVRSLEEATDGLLTLGIARFQDVAVGGDGPTERVRGVVVSGATLPMLGVAPALGRLPGPADDIPGGPCLAVLSHDIWMGRFGAAADVVGDVARLDGEPCVVAAVMPEGFAFPAPYWAPGAVWLLAGPTGVDWDSTDQPGFLVFGRLAPGTDPATARERIAAIPTSGMEGDTRFTAMRWAEPIRENAREELLVLLISAALVLVIACLNVMTLQVGRNVDRRGEIATRLALGASRWRLARLAASETALLTAVGAVAGLLVATLAVKLIVALRSFYIPRMEEVAIDGTAVGICLALSIVAGLVAAGIPALGLAMPGDRTRAGALRGTGRGLTAGRPGRRFGHLLVTAETAFAVVLLSGAVLLLRSYQALADLDPGFRAAGVVHARITPPSARYPDDASRTAFYAALEERVMAVSGVRDAALANVPPGVGAGADRRIEVLGGPPAGDDGPRIAWRSVSDGYFSTLDISLRRGRSLEDREETARAVLVNETFVRLFITGGDGIGERLRLPETPGEDTWEVVGVVADVREAYAHSPVPPTVYARYPDAPPRSMAILVHGAGSPLAVVEPLRHAVATLDADVPLFAVRGLDFMLASEHDLNRLGLALLALFAGTALVLAVAGIYGVVSHLVGRRHREMGIRIALGALKADVVRLVVADCLRFAVGGAAVGLTLAALLGDRLGALTHAWSGVEPWALGSAALLVIGAAVLAAWVPARRAAAADPVAALRRE